MIKNILIICTLSVYALASPYFESPKWIECERECSNHSVYIKIGQELLTKQNYLNFFQFEHKQANVIFEISSDADTNEDTLNVLIEMKTEDVYEEKLLKVFTSNSQYPLVMYLNSSSICAVVMCEMTCTHWLDHGFTLENIEVLKSKSRISYKSGVVVSNDKIRMYLDIGCKSVLDNDVEYLEALKESVLKIRNETIELLERFGFNSSSEKDNWF